ncbi:MAG: 50S ribosome-binding GTPase [Actinobacteria bacterium]|nr:50S ribosome-binding GTPase [Actinomycetota bacterium]
MPEGLDVSLDAAVDAAVAEGLGVVERLSTSVIGAFDDCIGGADAAAADHGASPGREVISTYSELLVERKVEAERRFGRQRTRLSTFNLVLFGRTGAGKSSLIEALSGGDGEPISQGESDWTTDVRDVYWRSSRLVDTPGIGGWGRTTSSAALEARAETAVADADVVILCFDTQSQQAGEFAKIARWVSCYGKPVVAVLNSRNARWRHPVRVGRQSSRQDLSRTVREHAGNIRDELSQIDLPDVPIVAIHSKRAAFARTSDPYTGPDADSRQKQRDEYGADRLLAWSNLPALELLLSEALARHAPQLRLGMLHEQARGLLSEAIVAVERQRSEASTLAEQLERGIADVLGLVGSPAEKGLAKQIVRLEKLRGGFGVAGPGEMHSHARYLLAAALQDVRAQAVRSAEYVVDTAFEDEVELTSEDFEQRVLEPARAQAESVARKVGSELQRHVARRLELVADDVRADLSVTIRSFEGAATTAGRSNRTIGIALETGSALLGIGSGGAFLAAALINSWNPAGWIMWTVFAVSFVGGMASSFVGGRLRRRAARDRVSALSAARADARKAIQDTFNQLERAISDDFARILSRATHEQLADDVAHALALRRVAGASETAVRDLQRALNGLPDPVDASHVLSDAANDLQRHRLPGKSKGARLLWLGESWCTDPEGLTDTQVDEPPPIHREPSGPSGDTHDPTRIVRVLEAAGHAPPAGSGLAWLSTALDALTHDPEASDALEPVRSLVDDARPRIVLAGDFSTGKSSFIKRMLVDSELDVPDGLDVAAQPRTDSAALFRWGDWDIVDTPGFQSSRPGHSETAHRAVLGASLVIILFNPNVVVGATANLLSVLLGAPDAGRVGKLDRALFVVNRSDELGIDPRDDLAGYRNLCRRKETELAQALGALQMEPGGKHVAVRADQIVCVASDPYGTVGDRGAVTRADYDDHRDWDGMDALRQGLAALPIALGRNAIDVQILEAGAATLADLAATRSRELADLKARIGQRRLLLLDLDACLNAGHALKASERDRLATTYVSFAARLFDDVATSQDVATQAARADQLEDWADHPEAQQLFQEWSSHFARAQEEWQQATSARVEARLTSAAFAEAFSAGDATLNLDRHRPVAAKRAQDSAVGGAKNLAKGAANATREGVTKAAHALGVKFRPWGATKLTAKVNAAGGALGVALGTVELYTIRRSVVREGEDERSRSEERRAALRQVRETTEAFFDSTRSDAPGHAMAEAIEQVQLIRDQEAARRDDAEDRAATLAAQIERCEDHVRTALELMETQTDDL